MGQNLTFRGDDLLAVQSPKLGSCAKYQDQNWTLISVRHLGIKFELRTKGSYVEVQISDLWSAHTWSRQGLMMVQVPGPFSSRPCNTNSNMNTGTDLIITNAMHN
jgi:hypothetical protein